MAAAANPLPAPPNAPPNALPNAPPNAAAVVAPAGHPLRDMMSQPEFANIPAPIWTGFVALGIRSEDELMVYGGGGHLANPIDVVPTLQDLRAWEVGPEGVPIVDGAGAVVNEAGLRGHLLLIMHYGKDRMSARTKRRAQNPDELTGQAKVHADHVFQIERTNAFVNVFAFRVDPKNQVSATVLAAFSKGLDTGSLPLTKMDISKANCLYANEERQETALGDSGLAVVTTGSDETTLVKTADLLRQLLKIMIALAMVGCRPITPNVLNPLVASVGEHGTIRMRDGEERWHVTLGDCMHFYFYFLEGASVVAGNALAAMVARAFSNVNSRLHENKNLATALRETVDSMGDWALLSRQVEYKGGGQVDSPSKRRTSRGRSQGQKAAKPTTGSAGGARSAAVASHVSPPPGVSSAPTGGTSQICRDFQGGNCQRSQCKFSHRCEKCGSSAHGRQACPMP